MIYETSIASGYVPNWGVKEGIREIIQNAMDSHDIGFKSGITYVRKDKKLIIFNRGAKLERKSMLLGSTTKANDTNLRGQYGEGFKLACLSLVRAGHRVRIHSQNEMWSAAISKSENFDVDVLTFKIQKAAEKSDKLSFVIEGIEPKEWKGMELMFLPIYSPDPKTILKTPDGKVLLDKNLKGRIYCGGIFVDEYKELEFGYDFNVDVLQLNRDRNMVSSFEVEWATSKMWAVLAAGKNGKLFNAHDMLKKNAPDVKYIKNFADYTVTGKVVDQFIKENNERSYPVTSDSEAYRVRSVGYTPVYSSSSYAETVRSKLGTIDDLERVVEADYELFQNITPIDDANIQYCFEVMHTVDHKFKFSITIATFALTTSRSKMNKLEIVINSNLLKHKYDLLHEVVMHYSNHTKKEPGQVWKELYKNTVEGFSYLKV